MFSFWRFLGHTTTMKDTNIFENYYYSQKTVEYSDMVYWCQQIKLVEITMVIQ